MLFENRRPHFNFSIHFDRHITPFQKKKRCHVWKQLKEAGVLGRVPRNLPNSGWLLSQRPSFRPGPQPSPLRSTIWVSFLPTGTFPPVPPHAWTSAHPPGTALNPSRTFRGEAWDTQLQIKATDFYVSNQTYHNPHVCPNEHCRLRRPPAAPPVTSRPLSSPSLSSGCAFTNTPQQ